MYFTIHQKITGSRKTSSKNFVSSKFKKVRKANEYRFLNGNKDKNLYNFVSEINNTNVLLYASVDKKNTLSFLLSFFDEEVYDPNSVLYKKNIKNFEKVLRTTEFLYIL